MTTNHTELCERLSADAGDVGKNYSSPIGHRIDDAVMLIEQQAARIQQQADRIAELEKERDALKADAIERCAKVCERHYDKNRPDFTRDPYITTLQCANAIRALLPKEES